MSLDPAITGPFILRRYLIVELIAHPVRHDADTRFTSLTGLLSIAALHRSIQRAAACGAMCTAHHSGCLDEAPALSPLMVTVPQGLYPVVLDVQKTLVKEGIVIIGG